MNIKKLIYLILNNQLFVEDIILQLAQVYSNLNCMKIISSKNIIYPEMLNPKSNIQQKFTQDMKRYYPKVANKKIVPKEEITFHAISYKHFMNNSSSLNDIIKIKDN